MEDSSSFIIKNSYTLIDKLNKLDNISNIIAYDFEDLYNSIDLTDLINKIKIFINEFHSLEVNRDQHFKLFHFVIQENYLYDGTKFYKQVRGITVGGKL